MGAELSLLKSFCDSKDSWVRYDPYIKEIQGMDRDMATLFGVVRQYYEKYPERESIESSDLMLFYDYLYPTARNKSFHQELIIQLDSLEVNKDLAEDMFEKTMERHEANNIINMLTPVLSGDKWGLLPEVRVKIEDFERRMKNPPQLKEVLEAPITPIDILIAQEIDPDGLRWMLPSLQEAIGNLRRKTFGLMFAYSDIGKTSFATKNTGHWARQLQGDEVIVYGGNEEARGRTELRLTQALTGWTQDMIKADPAGADKLRMERGFGRVKIFDGVKDTDYILRLLDKYHPIVYVADQMTKVVPRLPARQLDKETVLLEKLSNWFRETAKDYDCTMVGVTQGTGETSTKKFLELKDMYNSRVAIQQELDWTIGLGEDPDKAKSMIRYISIPKNKFGEHSRFACSFNQATNEWKEI